MDNHPPGLSFSSIVGGSTPAEKQAEFRPDDFPALGGQQLGMGAAALPPLQQQQQQQQQQPSSLPNSTTTTTTLSTATSSSLHSTSLNNTSDQQNNNTNTAVSNDPYSLFGLIDIIRLTDHDSAMVSLGYVPSTLARSLSLSLFESPLLLSSFVKF